MMMILLHDFLQSRVILLIVSFFCLSLSLLTQAGSIETLLERHTRERVKEKGHPFLDL